MPWQFEAGADPCSDSWQSIICSNYTGQSDIISLDHVDYYLNGTLPDSIGDLSGLHVLQLGSGLHGTIPATVSKLTNLTSLILNQNHLTGTIPGLLRSLTRLTELNLYGNHLNGSVPDWIGELPDLTLLGLGYNALTGQLPPSLSNLTNLAQVYLEYNYLHGPLLTHFRSMANLTKVSAESNRFTGHIPDSLCGLASLTQLELDYNLLSSTIPPCIGDLVNIEYVSLEGNRLTGPLPETMGSMRNLQNFRAGFNQLSQTIPESLGTLPLLTRLNLLHNGLVGTIPSSLWSLPLLQNLYLNTNQLTGLLPVFMNESYSLLEHINISSNCLHGAIPASIELLRELLVFSASENLFTGTIPATVGNMPLEVLQISNNMITGTIPPSFQQLSSLITLSLQGNRLSGSLDAAFAATQVNLITVQLDYNQFTGELPAVLFELRSLISLSIVGSCLHGTLPSNICNATSLEALVLYGLTTGASCRAVGVKALSMYEQQFGGAFPDCIFALPKLRTLLLASNRLTGQINVVKLQSPLLQLDLSHNLLSGTIPESIQNRSWALLDLSHNKLEGTLDACFFTALNVSLKSTYYIIQDIDSSGFNVTIPSLSLVNSVLSLDTNRLSGRVPNNVKPLRDVSVLAGNLFQCRYDKSDLPHHDSDIDNYECASNAFDASIYLWLGLTISIVLTRSYYLWKVAGSYFTVIIPDAHASKMKYVVHLLQVFQHIIRVSITCGAYCVVILLPTYAVLSTFEGTHAHQYAYILSAIYTSGVLPFALTASLLIVLLVVFLNRSNTTTPMPLTTPIDEVAHPSSSSHACVFASFVVLNIATVVGVNVAFVYTVLYQSTAAQTAAQVLLSLFKLGWSTAVSPWMIRQLDRCIDSRVERVKPYFMLQLLVALFNNIAIPCLVVMAVDPNCFSEIISQPSSKSVEFLLPVCVQNLQMGNVCQNIFYQRSSLSFTPPFTYSYQCSASIITSYAPAFVYMSIATVFLNPLLRYGMLRLHAHLANWPCVQWLVSMLLPQMLLPVSKQLKADSLFRAVGILVTLLMQLGVLLTFGAIFPPVALAMAVSIVATVYTARWELHKFTKAAVQADLLSCLDDVNHSCVELGSIEHMRQAVKMIICFCGFFYTLFLFDMLGDDEGFAASAWVLLVVPLAAPTIFCCQYSLTLWVEGLKKRRYVDKFVDSKDLEYPREDNLVDGREVVNTIHSS